MVVLDPAVGLVDSFGLEGRLSDQQGVEHDADCPDVDLEAVPRFAEYLGGDVVGGAAGGVPAISGRPDPGGEAEVAQLHLHLVVEEDVAELDIAVDDAVGVEVLEGVDDLEEVVLGLDLGEADPAPEEL